jgi:hypothetical protein
MPDITVDKRVSAPVKFDDRPGYVTEDSRAYRMGIREHKPSDGNRKFVELVHSGKPATPCYYVDRDGAQRMANGQAFYVMRATLGQARDRGYWIVGVGDEAGGSAQVGLLALHAAEGSEVPRRRWPHNAYQAEN